jgi:hypothetical protein
VGVRGRGSARLHTGSPARSALLRTVLLVTSALRRRARRARSAHLDVCVAAPSQHERRGQPSRAAANNHNGRCQPRRARLAVASHSGNIRGRCCCCCCACCSWVAAAWGVFGHTLARCCEWPVSHQTHTTTMANVPLRARLLPIAASAAAVAAAHGAAAAAGRDAAACAGWCMQRVRRAQWRWCVRAMWQAPLGVHGDDACVIKR